MRALVFFDLPTETGEDRKNYRLFRKVLIQNGFVMLQESVYCRMLTSPAVELTIRKLLHKNKPPRGLIQILTVTEKQFSKMEYIVGSKNSNIIDSDERVIVI